MGLTVERPCVNESLSDFNVVEQNGKKVIRFGLAAIKGVGQGAVDAILEVRESGDPFTSLFDFCERVDSQKANRRVLEALAKSGACDTWLVPGDIERAHVFASIPAAMEFGAQAQKDRRSGTRIFVRIVANARGNNQTGDKLSEGRNLGRKSTLGF